MEWFLNLNFIMMILYIFKFVTALLVVITILALIIWAFEVLIRFVAHAIDRD